MNHKILFALAIILCSSTFAGRKFLSTPYTYHWDFGANSADGTLYVEKVFQVSLINISANDQKVSISAKLSSARWSEGNGTNVPLKIKFATDTEEVAGGSGYPIPLPSVPLQVTVTPHSTLSTNFRVRYYGPAYSGTSCWAAQGTISFVVEVEEDRGAVSGGFVVSSSWNGNNFRLDTGDWNMLAQAGMAPNSVSFNGGRPF